MRRDRNLNANNIQHGDAQNNTTGLPYNVINSYHTFPYSKTNNVATVYDHETTCSICISDYEESEILRMMPQCRHYFHKDCVDVWLKVHASCPICRNSLVEARNNNLEEV
uniref:RING-H2 finger protein ATL2M n=2 Tax=Cajanus cajan TaxID=3821 RepID=A0A151RYI6_CAJCA|nr:RING-H2 finger protein ATL2M [Cajanus cajan]